MNTLSRGCSIRQKFKHGFLGKSRKEDLDHSRQSTRRRGHLTLKIIDLRNLDRGKHNYEVEFKEEPLNTVISQRTEEAEQRKLELEIEERRKEKKGN
ncbi:hypothetical protein AVEN_326-1 [Araneus ventricosus]|uniref:Uncharacterized protein n=1 Tax=Araneus ventricosus TaxID=182803 RepID=A0A4Y2HYR1_ARAVE|nr:hypothetical protein AVEN_326-1 [Araneus ventricosus]